MQVTPQGCCSPDSGAHILTTISPVVTWLLVAVGWYIVHWTAKRRARRQEQLQAVERIVERVLALRDKATDYFASTSDELPWTTADGPRIKLELKSVLAAIMALRDGDQKKYDLQSECMQFRKAITSDPFDSGARTALRHDDVVIQGVWLAADNLSLCLREEFERANKHF